MWQLSRLGCCSPRASSACSGSNTRTPLTGLPNHNRFFEVFDQALAARRGTENAGLRCPSISTASTRSRTRSATPAATRCWSRSASGCAQACRTASVIARLGSDEFVLLMPVARRRSGAALAHAVRQVVARPIWVNQVVQVSVQHRACNRAARRRPSRDELTRRADLALRAAKRRGRGSAVAFAADMEARSSGAAVHQARAGARAGGAFLRTPLPADRRGRRRRHRRRRGAAALEPSDPRHIPPACSCRSRRRRA